MTVPWATMIRAFAIVTSSAERGVAARVRQARIGIARRFMAQSIAEAPRS